MSNCDCQDPGVFGHYCGGKPEHWPGAHPAPEYVSALCIDGPARGDVITVPAHVPYYYALDYAGAMPEFAGTPPLCVPNVPVVTYTLCKFGFRSGGSEVFIRLASSAPGEPDARDLAGLLLSDAAKAALVPLRGAGGQPDLVDSGTAG